MLRNWQKIQGWLAIGVLGLAWNSEGGDSVRLFKQVVTIPERGEVTSYVLQVQTNKFTFLPPPNWTVRPSTQEKIITFLARDLSASMSLKITEARVGLSESPPSDRWREEVLETYPGAEIVRDFKCSTGGRQGLAFDLERVVQKKNSISSRLAFVPFPGGVIEIQLTAPIKKFSSHHHAFGSLLSSIRIEPASQEK